MQGSIFGVKKRLSDKIPQFIDFGSCNDHHIANGLKHGVSEYDTDIQQALVNVYMDIGGAKGKGLKKKKEFEELCSSIGLTPQQFKKFCSTRFRIIRECIKPVLSNWDGIVLYYSQVTKSTERQQGLKSFFVDREMMNYLNFSFIQAAIRELIEAIDYFEMRDVLLHEIRRKMEELLRNQIQKFHNEFAVKKADDNIEHAYKKSGAKLLEINLDDEKTLLKKKRIFIGQQATSFIESLDLKPNNPQLKIFYENVLKFHKTVASKLMVYFETGLRSTEVEYVSSFSPRSVTLISTGHKMNYLAKRFSKVMDNIEPQGGLDLIAEEIRSFTTDDNVASWSDKKYEEFWTDVSMLTEEETEWKKYPTLGRFALALGTAFDSNSEAERAFSVQTDIHRNPRRNLMGHDTFDAHMQIHFGVEGKGSKELCSKCNDHKAAQTRPPHHCHCNVAEGSEVMKNNCKTA